MENAVQMVENIHGDQDDSLKGAALRVLTTGANETVTGLCINCSHLSDCTLPMRGRALFCEEYS